MTRRLLILLTLALAVLLPPLLSGSRHLHQAEQAIAQGQPGRAAQSYAVAASLLFWQTESWEKAGRAALEAGQTDLGIQYLRRAPHLSSEGWLALAQAYRRQGDLAAAEAACQYALHNFGANAPLYRLLAEIYQQQQNLPGEQSALQNLLLLDSQDAAAHYRLGLLLTMTQPDQAFSHLLLASSLDPQFAPVVRTLRTALTLADLQPTEAGRLVTLGRGLALAEEWFLASQAFQQATRIDRGNAEAWAWLGEAKQHLGRAGSAELDQALALAPRSVIVRGLRGLYWKRQGNLARALEEYQQAAAIEPENPAWQATLGEIYAAQGDLVTALSTYQRAAQLAPDDPTYWRLLALFCAEYLVHLEDVGLPAAQKAVELAPADALTLDALGWAQSQAGRLFLAEQSLLAALKQNPNLAMAHLHLGITELRKGDRTTAYEHLLRARDLAAGTSLAQQAGQLLQQYFP
ncbi:MAG: tetratricopeptide repeat protein [Anaerolineae bacterium]